MCWSFNTKPASGFNSLWRSCKNVASVLTRQPEVNGHWKQRMHHDSWTCLLSFSAFWFVYFRHCKIKFFLHWRNERCKVHLLSQQQELSLSFPKRSRNSKSPRASDSWRNFWCQKYKFLRILLLYKDASHGIPPNYFIISSSFHGHLSERQHHLSLW